MANAEDAIAPMTAAVCTNVPACSQASARAILGWYAGPGEYCPTCGEVLAPIPRPDDRAPAALGVSPDAPTVLAARPAPVLPAIDPLIVTTVLAGLIALGAAVIVARTADAPRSLSRARVCVAPGLDRQAARLVNAYAAQATEPMLRFDLRAAPPCDVRVVRSAAADAARGLPVAVVALDAGSRPLADALTRYARSGSILYTRRQ